MLLRLPSPTLAAPPPSSPSSSSSSSSSRLFAPFRSTAGSKLPSQRFVSMASSSPSTTTNSTSPSTSPSHQLRLLFVEMGTGYDQHGQDVTAAAIRACKNAISSNSIPAFRTGALPGVTYQQMKLKVKLGVPHSIQSNLDIEKVKAVFPYGEILEVKVVDGGLICSSGVALEAMGDKNDDCYVVNAAVYVGY